MSKYIDADKLIKAIEKKGLDCSFVLKMERLDTLSLIDSLKQEQDILVINKKDWEAQEQFRKNKDFGKPLQQEQQEGYLDADIEMEWDSFNKHLAEYGEESEDVVWLNWYSFSELARRFYELGLKARKEE